MNKATTSAIVGLLPIIHSKLFRSGISSIMTLTENINIVYYGLSFKPCSPFLEIFNSKVAQLFEAGLTDYWIKKFQNPKGFTQKIDEIGPEIFEVGFLVCLIPLTLSIFVFVVESFAKRLKILVKKFIVRRF